MSLFINIGLVLFAALLAGASIRSGWSPNYRRKISIGFSTAGTRWGVHFLIALLAFGQLYRWATAGWMANLLRAPKIVTPYDHPILFACYAVLYAYCFLAFGYDAARGIVRFGADFMVGLGKM